MDGMGGENQETLISCYGTDEEFEELFSEKPVQKIALAGADSVLELTEKA